MKNIYNSIVLALENFIIFMHVSKMRYAEHYALYKKRKLYSSIKWSKRQKIEFNEFWRKYYGKKITSNGHKLYESINGAYHKDYFPDFLFATQLEPKLNNYIYARLYSDKSLTELLYNKSEKLIMPQTYLVKSNGFWYDSKRKHISSEETKKILFNLGEAIIKPTVGGNSGKGVLFCDFKDGLDINNQTEIPELLDSKIKDIIIQERMFQHSTLSNLYPHSINTIRVITYIANGKTYHAKLSLRIGAGGKKVDNIHSGGLCVGISDEGILLKYAYILGYSDSNLKLEHHPDTKIKFDQHKICGIHEVIEVAKELHGYTPHIGIISWDFTVSENGNPVLIEANYTGQSVWFPQIVNSSPLFGDNTKYMLTLIHG